MAKQKGIRTFKGKKYTRLGSTPHKARANSRKKNLKEIGYKVRIIKNKNLYQIWAHH